MASTLQTTDDIQKQTGQNISDSLKQVFGEEHQVIPTTAESEPEGDSLKDFTSRMIYNRAGHEPSRSFLRKMWERVIKKHPNSQVKLEDDLK